MKSLVLISVFIFTFVLTSAALIPVAFADTPTTPMVGVTTVCSDAQDFIAFNLAAKKIWIGQSPFQSGAPAFELENAAVEGNKAQFKFSGVMQITWGSTVYRNLIAGTTVFQGPTGQTQFTITPANLGGPKSVTLSCK